MFGGTVVEKGQYWNGLLEYFFLLGKSEGMWTMPVIDLSYIAHFKEEI